MIRDRILPMRRNNKSHDKGNALHIVIVGGGFGGLYAAKELGKDKNIRITLIDKRNFHLFQPLLYQVATGGLSPGDIASPLRSILRKYKNVSVIRGKVVDITPAQKKVILEDGDEISYDKVIIATGARYNYFGNTHWLAIAPGIKTMEDSLGIRHRIFHAYESAERENDDTTRKEWMRFIIVGGGPTGVELAGALGELANHTLVEDFRNIDTRNTEIMLVEGMDRILPTYPESLSKKAEKSLKDLGVTIKTNTFLTDMQENQVTFKCNGSTTVLRARTILWAAGVKASMIGKVLKQRLNVETDKSGRVHVNPDLTVDDRKDIFVIGDLAYFAHGNGQPLPGLAPVAMQQGKYVADLIKKRMMGEESEDFRYVEKGSLAVIGRNKAVAHFGKFKFSGFFAWLVWILVHIRYLIEFDNKMMVFFQWAWNYITMKRGARLITGDDPFPYMDEDYYTQVKNE